MVVVSDGMGCYLTWGVVVFLEIDVFFCLSINLGELG